MSATATNANLIAQTNEWNFELLAQYDEEIGAIAADYGLDTYPNQIEVISSEQMLDAYATVGMPVGYHHWSYGKKFIASQQSYQRGHMGLAYEIVINSNPCIAYLMEENTLTMQALVIAHACYGHNSFFKGNYLFQTWTDADSIIDYLVFARHYVQDCEARHGVRAVEDILDSCHALMNYGVDRYRRPYPISVDEERRRQRNREEYIQRNLNDLWRTLPDCRHDRLPQDQTFPAEPQENLLYFIEKHAPLLEPWQRELVRIVRKLAQYFYPQRQTQVMNEGWATFWHYTLLNTLYDRGKVSDGFMLEFLASHSAVLAQPDYDHPAYSGINPYTLGFAIFSDLRRMCEHPTKEDHQWFPDVAGKPWQSVLFEAMRNFKDESFIQQFLSPKVMRDLKLFAAVDDDQDDAIVVAAIHNDEGFAELRAKLASQYNLGDREPNIQVTRVDVNGDRSLHMTHTAHERKPLHASVRDVLRHVYRLWQFPVRLDSVSADQVVESFSVGDG